MKTTLKDRIEAKKEQKVKKEDAKFTGLSVWTKQNVIRQGAN